MDNPQIKERSYRIVHTMRLRNQRENRLLYEKLYSKQGLHSTYINELNAVTREQQRIRRELAKIRKTMSTTWGALPARDPPTDQRDSWPAPNRIAPGIQEPKEKKRRRKANRSRCNDSSSTMSRSNVDASEHSGRDPDHDDSNKPELGTDPLMLPSLGDQSENIGREKENESAKQRTEGLVHLEPAAARSVAHKRASQDALSERDIDEAKGKIRKRLTGSEVKSQSSSSSSSSASSSSSGSSTSTKANIGAEKPRKSNRKPVLTPIEETVQEDVVADARNDMPLEVQNKKALSDADSLETAAGKKGQKKRRNSETPAFDTSKYNPDGSVRTVHVMPDMPSRMNEARKARYIRHKELMERERELSISEILGEKNKENTDTVASESADSTCH